MVRIGMLGKWHVHAEDYAKQVKESSNAVITAVWDDNIERGKGWADQLAVPFEADLDTFLGRDDIDAIICDTATVQHKEVLVKAAKAGKHIFTEKVLATTVADSEKIAAAVRDNGVQFAISFPQLTFPDVLLARSLVKGGKLGALSSMRMRNAHAGLVQGWLPDYWMREDEAGGGALMDLGAHPVYLANEILGEPKRVTAVMSRPLGHETDEAATVLVEYDNGQAAVLETSLISWNSPRVLEFYGTDGHLFSLNETVKVDLKSEDGSTEDAVLPERAPMPIKHFLAACEGEGSVPAEFGLDAAIRLTKVMVAAYESAKTGNAVTLRSDDLSLDATVTNLFDR